MISYTTQVKFVLFVILFFGTVAQILAVESNLNQPFGADKTVVANTNSNGKIAFVSNRTGNDEIFTMNPDGSDQTNITNDAAQQDYSPAWSPDGRKIVFVRRPIGGGVDDDVYIMNANGTNLVRLTNDGDSFNPEWTPDGTKIVFARSQEIYLMNADGTNLVRLTTNGFYDAMPTFSPDGSRVAYLCSRPFNGTPPGRNDEICVMNADGSNERILAAHPAADLSPAWSPDGTKITFVSNRNGNGTGNDQIYSVNADGSNLLNLSNSSTFDFTPTWSPDNSKIAFTRDGGIYVMNANGTNQTQLPNPASGRSPTWQRVNASAAAFDFDGDGKTDASVYRSGTWFINPSGANNPSSYYGTQFGLATDQPTPADFDGDGKTDIAVWRGDTGNPERAIFYILNSRTNTVRAEQFGSRGDDPRVVGDWDGDGLADLAVYRAGANGGQSVFYYRPSTQQPGRDFVAMPWGAAGDEAVRGDFDGDSRIDAAIFRPSNRVWYILNSSNNQPRVENWGLASDKRVAGDYDGDGKTDLTVFRDGVWYVLQSSNNQPRYQYWGLASDKLVPGDYDGDGQTDFAIWRAGVYYILRNSNSQAVYQSFGASDDVPVASAFVR